MRRALLAVWASGMAALSAAAPIAWVLNTNTTKHMVNVPTNAEAPIGSTGFLSDSLARTPGGTLISADANGVLWDVTGVNIPIGPTGRTQIGDLDWANNGVWGFSNATNELFFFDLGLTSVTYAATISLPSAATVTGVAHQASTGDIYLSANAGLNTDRLLHIPFSTTTALLVGPMAISDAFSFVSDIDFDASGTLYAMTWFHRDFLTVSTSTAVTTFVSAGPHRDTTGMAFAPVPEPGAFLALGAGCWMFGRRRRSSL